MESSIGEFPKIGKFPTLRSPDKSGKNSPALQINSEIFQGEPLRGEFVENVWTGPRLTFHLYKYIMYFYVLVKMSLFKRTGACVGLNI